MVVVIVVVIVVAVVGAWAVKACKSSHNLDMLCKRCMWVCVSARGCGGKLLWLSTVFGGRSYVFLFCSTHLCSVCLGVLGYAWVCLGVLGVLAKKNIYLRFTQQFGCA